MEKYFDIFFNIYCGIIYGIVIVLFSYFMIPQLLNCKAALNNISILKKKPLYLSKITEIIFLLYKSFQGDKKKIKNLQTKNNISLFISYFKEKIKQEKGLILLFSMGLFFETAIIYSDGITIKNLIYIIFSCLFIIISLKIIKYSKSWSDSFSNLSQWNEFFSNYEITPKVKELNLLERDFQQFDIESSNQKRKCPTCGNYNHSFSNYCVSCGNELKNEG